MDNQQLQSDELEVLAAIFGDDWEYHEPSKSYKMKINKDVYLWITLHSDYPSSAPPKYELNAPTLSKEQKDNISKEFYDIYNNLEGQPVIFEWVQKLKEVVDLQQRSIKESNILEEIHTIGEETNLDIIHGPSITDRKSTFQAHVCKIENQGDISVFVDALLKNRKISQATHNILSYRLENNNVIMQDYDDDGETHAGSRLLHLLQILDVKNVAVVVTRWYGGIHLGADRFKHINNAARNALTEAGYIDR